MYLLGAVGCISGMRDAFSVYSPVRLVGGIAGIGIGVGSGAQASDTTPVGGKDSEGTLLVILASAKKWEVTVGRFVECLVPRGQSVQEILDLSDGGGVDRI